MHVTALLRGWRWLGAALMAALLLAPARAEAQRGIDAHTFRPALDGYGLFGVDRAEVGPQLAYGFALTTDYAHQPLRLDMFDPMTGKSRAQVMIGYQVSIELGGHLGLTRWLELVASFPVSAQSYGAAYGQYGSNADPTIARTGFYAADRYTNIPPPNAAPGDGRVGFKARLYHNRWLGLGAAALVTIPFGDDAAFLGDSGYTFRPEAIVDVHHRGLDVALNLGAIVRSESRVYDPYDQRAGVAEPRLLLDVGHELTAALGVSYRVVPLVALVGEVHALVPLVGARGQHDYSADALAGLQLRPRADLTVAIAAGGGILTDAHRRDDFRVLAAVNWVPVRASSSRDSDGDGVPDGRDQCPDEAEDRDGFADDDGCPDPDNDGDGILDAQDRCPGEPEDRDGFADEDGCPDLDNDGDGIPDAIDHCANEPENVNGIDDADGCPEGRGESELAVGPLDLSTPLAFEARRSSLSAGSERLLDDIANRLLAHQKVRRVRIEGHADAGEGAPARALALSQARAQAVRDALIRRGVAPDRLQAVAYGSSRPLDQQKTEEARAHNRRVELIVVEQ